MKQHKPSKPTLNLPQLSESISLKHFGLLTTQHAGFHFLQTTFVLWFLFAPCIPTNPHGNPSDVARRPFLRLRQLVGGWLTHLKNRIIYPFQSKKCPTKSVENPPLSWFKETSSLYFVRYLCLHSPPALTFKILCLHCFDLVTQLEVMTRILTTHPQ